MLSDPSADPPEQFRRVSAFGAVLEAGRGHLPFALLHGEPLVACAAWALGEAGVTLVDVGTPWSELAEAEEPLVLHDPLCPMTPPGFVVDCVEHALASGAVTVGVRAVTDTVKQVADGYVGATLDRDSLLQVVSPVVLPPTVVAALDGLPTEDLAALVSWLASRFPVETLAAPPSSRRVTSESDLRLLEALTGSGPPAATRTP